MTRRTKDIVREALGWAVVFALLAVLLRLVTGCAEMERAHGAGGESTGTAWTIAFPAWLAAFGLWLWSGLLGMFGITTDAEGLPVDFMGLASTWWPALAPALAAFPKVRDAVGAAVAKDTPLLERPVALVSPALPLVHSPPSVKKQEAARKARKAARKARKAPALAVTPG